jgi:hypothetical protein
VAGAALAGAANVVAASSAANGESLMRKRMSSGIEPGHDSTFVGSEQAVQTHIGLMAFPTIFIGVRSGTSVEHPLRV